MKRGIRLVLAVVAGFAVGSLANMGTLSLGGLLVPPPAGADTGTVQALRATIHLFEPRHFLFPFLAHALGTLAGAAVATVLAPGRTRGPAWAVGILFLLGGIASAFMLPGPAWFAALDLVAYLPAAWLGYRLARTLPRPE